MDIQQGIDEIIWNMRMNRRCTYQQIAETVYEAYGIRFTIGGINSRLKRMQRERQNVSC